MIWMMKHYFPLLSVATGYAAKKVCTCTLVTGLSLEAVQNNDLYYSILPYVDHDIDFQSQTVTSSIFGLAAKTAVVRKGFGCILLDGQNDDGILMRTEYLEKPASEPLKSEWEITTKFDNPKLQTVVESTFDPQLAVNHKRTTGIVIIHRDTLVAEQYAQGFQKYTPQLGWSMTKSWMNAFVGLLVKEQQLDVTTDHLFPEWHNDQRKKIQLHHLLQMNSGLIWEEDYTKDSDATHMLYKSADVSQIPLGLTAIEKAGQVWKYSSGTTNLISKYVRNQLKDEVYLKYLNRHLFNALGMHSAFIEVDETGTFIGSSYGYATPRDWATFGLLYLKHGCWFGHQMLPENWIEYSTTESTGSNGQYGAHFWLNKGHCQFKNAPEDAFSANGYQGQYVVVIPSYDLVIVRLGSGEDYFDIDDFIGKVIASIKK